MADVAYRSSSSEGGGSFSSAKRGTMGALPQMAFNYDAAKAGVQKGFDASTTAQFRRFFASPLFDRLARACLQHFLARFEHDLLCKALERATLQRLVGFAPEAVRARLSELQAEAEAQLDALAPAYALALLQNSAPRQPHQDMLFFRALYEALMGLVAEAFPRRPLAEVEARVGELLCTPAFNLYARRHRAARLVDELGLEDLSDLKHGGGRFSGSRRARLLASLREKPDFINVQVACQTNSQLLARFVASPEVARAAGLAAALAAKQAQRRGEAEPFALPAAMLDGVTQSAVKIDRSGMISDAALAELALLRRVLAGKDPLEGLSRHGSASASMLRTGSMMRLGSVMRGSSVMAPSRATQVVAHG